MDADEASVRQVDPPRRPGRPPCPPDHTRARQRRRASDGGTPAHGPRHAAADALDRLSPAPHSATEKPTGTTPEEDARPVGPDDHQICAKIAPDPIIKRSKPARGSGNHQTTIVSASPSAQNRTQKVSSLIRGPSRRLFRGAARHLRAEDAARREGSPPVLPREPYDDRSSGRLSVVASAGHAGRSGVGCGDGRGFVEPGGCGERSAAGRGGASRRAALGSPPGSLGARRPCPGHRADPRPSGGLRGDDGGGSRASRERQCADEAARSGTHSGS